MKTKPINKKKEIRIQLDERGKNNGVFEGYVVKETEKIFVFKITHAQIFKSMPGMSSNDEVDITHQCTPEAIESFLQRHFEKLDDYKSKKIIITKQKRGKLTDTFIVFCRKEGYFMQPIYPKPMPEFFLGARNDEYIRKSILFYQKEGARLIFQEGTRPDHEEL